MKKENLTETYRIVDEEVAQLAGKKGLDLQQAALDYLSGFLNYLPTATLASWKMGLADQAISKYPNSISIQCSRDEIMGIQRTLREIAEERAIDLDSLDRLGMTNYDPELVMPLYKEMRSLGYSHERLTS